MKTASKGWRRPRRPSVAPPAAAGLARIAAAGGADSPRPDDADPGRHVSSLVRAVPGPSQESIIVAAGTAALRLSLARVFGISRLPCPPTSLPSPARAP